MNISADTTVHELLSSHPQLLDFLAGWAPEFAKLRNPVLRNTIGRAATLEAAAAMADRPVSELLEAIDRQLALTDIHSSEGVASSTSSLSPAERERRQEALKSIIRKLHDGASVEEVKADFDMLVQDVDAAEVAAMEQALIAEGMPVEEVQRLCDVHVKVFKEALEHDEPTGPALDPDHPISAYVRENVEIVRVTAVLKEALDRLGKADSDKPTLLSEIGGGLDELKGIDLHYLRKENQLFPVLETHGVEGPTKVMWALDDDIRARLKTERTLVTSGAVDSLARSLPETLRMIDDMVYKEEKILFPTALQVITDEEWGQIAAGDAEIGYAWGVGGDTPVAGAPAAPVLSGPSTSGDLESGSLLLPLTTGGLTLEQLNLMLQLIPFDITYVDAHDRVRFYSEGERVFPRSPGAIGREVRNCHPPASVDKVERILAEFKAGTKDLAEFWIQLGEKFVHIRYFAIRNTAGVYEGCLEVVQDATGVRALQGQRRLLDW